MNSNAISRRRLCWDTLGGLVGWLMGVVGEGVRVVSVECLQDGEIFFR